MDRGRGSELPLKEPQGAPPPLPGPLPLSLPLLSCTLLAMALITLAHAKPTEETIDDMLGELHVASHHSSPTFSPHRFSLSSSLPSSPSARRSSVAELKMRRRSIDKHHNSSPLPLKPTRLREGGCKLGFIGGLRKDSALLRELRAKQPAYHSQLLENEQRLAELSRQQLAIAAELASLRSRATSPHDGRAAEPADAASNRSSWSSSS